MGVVKQILDVLHDSLYLENGIPENGKIWVICGQPAVIVASKIIAATSRYNRECEVGGFTAPESYSGLRRHRPYC